MQPHTEILNWTIGAGLISSLVYLCYFKSSRASDKVERLEKVARVIFIFSFINFIAFMIGIFILGGDAVSGYRLGDHYFVAGHGRITEVSRLAFAYSRIHFYSVWVTYPVGIVSVIAAHEMRNAIFRRR